MSRSVPIRLTHHAALLLPGCSAATEPADAPPHASADADHIFGFPLGFSPTKMDHTADSRHGLRRYAVGRWLDTSERVTIW